MAAYCRNCWDPLEWIVEIGWLHSALSSCADQLLTCGVAEPSCEYSLCDHTAIGPDESCGCKCHRLYNILRWMEGEL